MRLRLGILIALMAIVLAVVGETWCPCCPVPTRDANRTADLGSAELLLDGSECGSRLFPHFADFDGTGTIDMLVGVSDRLLVFRNTGTNRRPQYAGPTWFDEVEASARIPGG